jgi:hypothetical protein
LVDKLLGAARTSELPATSTYQMMIPVHMIHLD